MPLDRSHPQNLESNFLKHTRLSTLVAADIDQWRGAAFSVLIINKWAGTLTLPRPGILNSWRRDNDRHLPSNTTIRKRRGFDFGIEPRWRRPCRGGHDLSIHSTIR